MDKNEALDILNELNNIIIGSNKVIKSLEETPNKVNIQKALKAAFLNNIKLAKSMKKFIDKMVESNTGGVFNGLGNMFNKFPLGK